MNQSKKSTTTPFQTTLYKAQKYLATKENLSISRLKKNFKTIIPYLQSLFNRTNPVSTNEFEKAIIEDCKEYSKIVFESSFVNDYFIDLLSCRYFQKHKNEFDIYLEKVRDPNFKLDASDQSFEGHLKSYVYMLNDNFPEYLEDIKSSLFRDNIVYQIINNNRIPSQERLKLVTDYVKKAYPNKTTHERVIKYSKIVLYGPREYLEYDEENLIYDLSKDSKNSILKIIEQSKKFGFYEGYSQLQENQFRILGLPNYASKNANLLESPQLLDNLSLEDLFVLNCFWLNRYSKDLDNYGTAVFVLKDLNLFEEIFFKGNNSFEKIPDKTLKNELIKYGFLNYPTTHFIKRREAQIDNFDTSNIKGFSRHENFVTYSYDPLVNQAEKKYGTDYTKFFNLSLPQSSNDIREDIRFFAYLYNPVISSYSIKVLLLQALSTQLENFKNAGIVLENQNSNKLLLGIDAFLTFPIFEHLNFNSLKDFYIAYTGNSKVPIYDGSKDFISLTGDYLSTQLALPVTEKQAEILKQTCKKQTYPAHSKNTVQHLYFLKDSSRLPDSLTVPETIGTKKRLRLPKRYLDLEDGKFYTKDEAGAFIPIAPTSPTNLIKEGDEYGD